MSFTISKDDYPIIIILLINKLPSGTMYCNVHVTLHVPVMAETILLGFHVETEYINKCQCTKCICKVTLCY